MHSIGREPLPFQVLVECATLKTEECLNTEIALSTIQDSSVAFEVALNAWKELLKSFLEEGDIVIIDFNKSIEIKAENSMKAFMQLISDASASKKSIKHLQFNQCQFSFYAWQIFIHQFETTSITHLSFKDCQLSYRMESLASLQIFKKRLEGLRLEEEEIAVSQAKALAVFLFENRALEELALVKMQISDLSMDFLAKGLINNCYLKKLSLEHNKIGMEGSLHLSLVLRCNLSLIYLSLFHNCLEDEALLALAQGILTKRKVPLELNLGQNERITQRGLSNLFYYDGINLGRLNLEGNPNIISLQFLKSALKAHSLAYLNLSNTGISNKSADEFLEWEEKIKIRSDCSLTIQFSNNILTPEAIEELKLCFEPTPVKIIYSQVIDYDVQYLPLLQDIQKAEYPMQEHLSAVLQIKSSKDKERLFAALLSKAFIIEDIPKDGNCLFKSIAQAVDRQNLSALDFRIAVVNYIEKHPDDFKPFLMEFDGGVDKYCQSMRQGGAWGGELELAALIGVFQELQIFRPIHILDSEYEIKIVNGLFQTNSHLIRGEQFSGNPIFLYRENQNHYRLLNQLAGSRKRAHEKI